MTPRFCKHKKCAQTIIDYTQIPAEEKPDWDERIKCNEENITCLKQRSRMIWPALIISNVAGIGLGILTDLPLSITIPIQLTGPLAVLALAIYDGRMQKRHRQETDWEDMTLMYKKKIFTPKMTHGPYLSNFTKPLMIKPMLKPIKTAAIDIYPGGKSAIVEFDTALKSYELPEKAPLHDTYAHSHMTWASYYASTKYTKTIPYPSQPMELPYISTNYDSLFAQGVMVQTLDEGDNIVIVPINEFIKGEKYEKEPKTLLAKTFTQNDRIVTITLIFNPSYVGYSAFQVRVTKQPIPSGTNPIIFYESNKTALFPSLARGRAKYYHTINQIKGSPSA